MKKTFSSFLTAVFVFLLIGSVYAAVEIYSAGTAVDKTEKINITGPTIAKSGTKVNVDVTELTGLTVAGDIYTERGISVDGSLYLNGADGVARPIYIRQPDGGCSACGLDTGGTTFSCLDTPCPSGMTQVR